MPGRASLLAIVAATALVQRLPALPGHAAWLAWIAIVPGLIVLCFLAPQFALQPAASKPSPSNGYPCWHRCMRNILCILLCFVLALGWALWRAHVRVQDALLPENEDRVARVVLRVAELVREAPGSRRFVAQVLGAQPAGVPGTIEVAWYGDGFAGPYGDRSAEDRQTNVQPDALAASDFPDIIPGQIWRMALNLRRVSGAHNPRGFDYEGHQFAKGIRAQASVRGTPELLAEHSLPGLSLVAEFLRHHIRQNMRPWVQDKPYAGVLLALAIGDQASIPPDQWVLFNRSGLTHLVAISGTHITMIAVLGAWLMNALWRRLAWRGRSCCERIPAQIMAALAALLVAWIYCLLAGWGVPARRTFLMLTVAALAYVARLPVSPSHLLCLVAALVVLLDPWALTSSGFWLSFAAVAVLLAHAVWAGQALVPRPSGRPARVWRFTRHVFGLQLTICLMLMPLLALWFNQLPLVSPLSNAYAIPAIGLVVTPLALLLAAVSTIPGLEGLAALLTWAAHGVLAVIMPFTQWLADQPWAVVHVASAPLVWMALAFMGVCLALLPRGWPLKPWAWLAMLPAFFWQPAPLPWGQWRMTVLDVGQASAVLIQTRHHTLLFDTGLRYSPTADAAQRLLLPFLRSQGIRHLDTLVVSHADIDHVGGLGSLLRALPVTRSYASFDVPAFLRREALRLGQSDLPPLPADNRRCTQGTSWQVDGVQFRFLWPPKNDDPPGPQSRSRNARSCVLRLQSAHHAALLPADIGSAQEAQMLQSGQTIKADVVIAPHHGSRFSSSASWIAATRPQAVVAQAGRWNRYNHPHPDTVQRWTQSGAWFVSTPQSGAVQFHSSPQGLTWTHQRELRQRYWHGK